MIKSFANNSGEYLPIKIFSFPSYRTAKNSENQNNKIHRQAHIPKVASLREFRPEYLNPKLARPSSSSKLPKHSIKPTALSQFASASSLKVVRPQSAGFFGSKVDRRRNTNDTHNYLNYQSINPQFANKMPSRYSKILSKDKLKDSDEERESKDIENGMAENKGLASFERQRMKVVVQAWVPQPVVYNINSLN